MKTFQKPLTVQEEAKYLKFLQKGDKEARDILIERNLRLVAHIVKKYNVMEKEIEELLSIGTIGLIKGVSTFDCEKGNRLATYCAKCVENELLMLFRSDKKRNREVSIYEPVGMDKEGNEVLLIEVIENGEMEVPEVILKREETRRMYEAYHTCLDEREKKIIRSRYGLFGTHEHTQREIAADMGISRSYISRIEKGALEKMRQYMKS